jgi:hypothetical protein
MNMSTPGSPPSRRKLAYDAAMWTMTDLEAATFIAIMVAMWAA